MRYSFSTTPVMSVWWLYTPETKIINTQFWTIVTNIKSVLIVLPVVTVFMIFPRDGIQNPFIITNHPSKTMARGPAGISHTLEGAGIVDSSSTSECELWKFYSFSIYKFTFKNQCWNQFTDSGYICYLITVHTPPEWAYNRVQLIF